MTFLQKKLKETVPKDIYEQILLIEQNSLEEFEKIYESTLNSLPASNLNTLLDFIVAKIKIPLEIKISFLKKMLAHDEQFLRERVILYLEGLLQKDCLSIVIPLRDDTNRSIRAQVYWVLAKYTFGDDDLTQQIIDDFKLTTTDSDQVMFAAALFQRNDDPSSLEMRFLNDFYLEHYYDPIKQTLKVSLTGEHGHAAQFIGLILWEANIKIFALESLEMHDALWLVEKIDEKVPF
ncbi:MAG: hypothetical protein ACTSSK_05540 [Candidatus Heimdallarchaeota archaeon]